MPKTNGSNSKPKITKSVISNKTKPSTSRGSNTSVASSSSSVDLGLSKSSSGIWTPDDPRPELQSMTLATSNLGLVPNLIPQQPCIPPLRDDWDCLFQPMSDEYFNPLTIAISSVLAATVPRAVDLADSLVSTSTDQDAPSIRIISPVARIEAIRIVITNAANKNMTIFQMDVKMAFLNDELKEETSNTLHNAIMDAGGKDRPPMLAPDKVVSVSEGSPERTTEAYMETYKNVSQDIRDQVNAEAKVVQIILIGIDNDIYSIVDACPNACEMWKAIERFYKMMNELVRNQCDVTNHQVNVLFLLQLQPEWKMFVTLVKQSQELKTVSYHKLYDILKQHQNEVNELRAERITRTTVVQKSRIQCYNCKEFRHVVRECQKPKRAKDAAYHRENMILCKQEEAGIQLNAEQVDWRDDTVVESEDQELEAHFMYMAQIQEVNPDVAADSGPIFDSEPLQKVSNDDHYNVFAIESEHPKQSKSVYDTYPIEQDEHNVIIDSLDMSYDREQIDQNDDDDLANECELLASLIEKLKCEIDDNKNRNKFLETSNKVLVDKLKEAQIKLYKTREDKELDTVIALENKVKVLDNIVYKTGQSVQTMNMLNRNCKTSFAKPEFLKKAQRVNPRLYDICCYNDNLALMLAPESDEVICLEQESRSKLSDLIRPFDYEKLNNLYDLFVPQREKLSEQRYFSERSRMSHTPINNGNSKESFNKQTTLLESIPYDQKCKSSKELFKIKRSVGTIIDGVERCKETIAKRTYFGYIDPFIQNIIEANFSPETRRINADLEKFHVCLKEEMVADLRYFNSLELEVDSLKSQLETQNTQFLNEIDRLSREYYYANHMNAILGVYTELDEVTNLQCDYLEMLEKYECLEKELSKSKMMSKSFEALQKHAINLEINLQQYHSLRAIEWKIESCLTIVKERNRKKKTTIGMLSFLRIKRPKCVLNEKHDMCVLKSLDGMNFRTKMPIAVPGNDLLTGSRGTYLYSITLQDTSSPNLISLMAKATSSQAWLWHHRLSHLNFDTINLLSKNDIVVGLPKLKFVKDHLCSSCELGKAKRKSFQSKTTPRSKRWLQLLHMDLCGPMIVQRGLHAQVKIVRTDKGMEFLNNTLHAYFASKGIHHRTSIARTLEQNDIVERRNRTLGEAAQTMLSTAKVPLFFWAEAIATLCFTQNRSHVIPRHEKTPYHIINDQKPSVKFFHIFGSLCYIVRDGENLDKMKEKGDACIFVRYSTQSRAYMVFNKRTRVIVESVHVNFDEFPHMESDHAAETVTTSNELDLLFSLMFYELLNGSSQVVLKSSAETTLDASNQRQHQHTTPLNTQTTPEPTCQVPTHAPTVTSTENINQAEMIAENTQTKDHPLEQVIRNPSQSVRTRRQLESDGEMFMFALTEELYQFDRLDVWELVDRPLYGRKTSHNKFEMSMMGELKLFLGIQIHQSPRGIFINQAKYAQKILIKHGMTSCDRVGTPIATKHLDADLSGTPIDQTKYRSMVRALMYLIASRPDIMHATCYCARYQGKPTEKHLTAIKRIFQYLKDTIHMGLWYPKDIGFELTTFLDSDHAGCLDSRKSTSGGIQFLGGDKLVSWSSKKRDCTSMSSAEAGYVSLSACCAQVLWMRTQLTDYGFHFDKIPMYCDSKAAIAILCNPVQHSRTKHNDVRYHFIKEKVEKGIVE
nr:uncharacterized mitochondrial protein AtMg00810-like [Tanacetum cinerariifolium]